MKIEFIAKWKYSVNKSYVKIDILIIHHTNDILIIKHKKYQKK